MFQNTRNRSAIGSVFTIMALIYHNTVRNLRKTHGNALMALGSNMMTAVVFVLAFYVMFSILGLRGAKIRGDFLLYMMSGVFLYLTHVKTIGAVAGAEGPSSPMMQHAPMNTFIAICSGALEVLYIQTLSMMTILFVYHMVFTPIEIQNPIGAYGMFMLAWFTGIGVGLLFMSLRAWFPTAGNILQMIYTRANMIASGKLFVANTLPMFMLKMFDWNPLFHAIDQCRGFVFLNYLPRNSSLDYPIYVGIVLLMIGLMIEFYTRQHASSSWYARR